MKNETSEVILTRDQARQAYQEADLDYFPVNFSRMEHLRDLINEEMLCAGLMGGTLHMKHSSSIKIHDQRQASLRCEAYYFDDREAVTFNDGDPRVGFAGWADDQNVQPILRGFLRWVEEESEIAELN